MIEELLRDNLAEQKKTNELLQVIVSNQEQSVEIKVDSRLTAEEISRPVFEAIHGRVRQDSVH